MTSAFDPQGDNQIADLLKLAGRRPSPGAERMQQARDAARLEWRRSLAVRGRRRMVMTGAAAASVALLAASGWLWTMRPPKIVERPEIATVQVAVGNVRITDADGRPVAAVDGAIRRLRAGDRVEVAERGRAAFQLGEGTSIRLAGGTAVVFISIGRLQLAQGGVYVDADPARRAGSVTVETPFATVSHVGTQFELRSDPGSLDVRVREGEVSVDLPGRPTDHACWRSVADRPRTSRGAPDDRDFRSRVGVGDDDGAAVCARGRDCSGVSRVGEPRAGLALGVCGCRRPSHRRARGAAWDD